MSKRKRRGNIEAKSVYDPFPRTGLIKKYEPFIKKEVRALCARYSFVRYDEALAEAVRLAHEAEKKFEPERGHKFGTLLRYHLKRLNRWAQKEASSEHITATDALQAEAYDRHDALDVDGIGAVHADGIEALATNLDEVNENNLHKLAEPAPSVSDINTAENSKARDNARFEEEQAQPIGDIDYTGGGNAARVTLDISDKGRRIQVGIQLHAGDESHVRGFTDRVSGELRSLRDILDPAVVRVAVAHHERKQREEAEDCRLLPREELRPHIKFVSAKTRRPRLRWTPVPKRTGASDQDSGFSWKDVAGRPAAEQLKLIKRAAATLRPLLTPGQSDFLNWMVDLRIINEGRINAELRHVGGSLTELSDRLGVDKGNASRTVAKLQKRLWAILQGFLMD